jgi:type I restriction enzyme, S subunit
MEIAKGYKQTEVGVIPEDWDTPLLGSLVEINSGESPSKFHMKTEGIPFFKVEQLNNHPKWAKSTPYYIENNKTIRPGSLIFPKRGASIFQNKIRLLHKPSFMDTNLMTLTSTESLHNEYLFYTLIHFGLDQVADTTSVPQINNKHIRPFQIPLPPTKAEQEAIAEALSDADSLIESLQQLIAKKRHIKQGAMQELLTGKKRLHGFSGEWEAVSLGGVASFFKGRGLPKSALTPSGSDPCIHYGELFTQYDHTIEEVISRTDATSDSFRSCANDVLMPTSDVTPRGLAKASCVTQDEIVLGGDILVIRTESERVNGSFLSCLIRLEEKQVLQLVKGSTVYHLYASDMKNFRLRLPSHAEQTRIATILSDMDEEITALETKLNKARQLKQGMMQELLTGRIRLV